MSQPAPVLDPLPPRTHRAILEHATPELVEEGPYVDEDDVRATFDMMALAEGDSPPHMPLERLEAALVESLRFSEEDISPFIKVRDTAVIAVTVSLSGSAFVVVVMCPTLC